MDQVRVQDAIGMVLCHDITEIVPGKTKGRAFKKGHIIEEKDIEKLLDLGKQHIYVWNLADGYVHENDAALRMVQAAAGEGFTASEVKEGKIELRAACDGVIRVNEETLFAVNSLEGICFATIHGGRPISEGKIAGACRVIPLVEKEETIAEFERICAERGPILEVLPYKKAKIAIVTTGSEVASGRIQDAFGPALRKKAQETGSEIIGQTFPGDDPEAIAAAILAAIDQGADLVEVSGGMSVDPDDCTPAAIRSVSDEVITYGTPVLPGAMFMLAYRGETPIVGLPGCVMFNKRTVFDLAVPRILAGEKLTKKDFVRMGYGGQCQGCAVCTFPECGFGN